MKVEQRLWSRDNGWQPGFDAPTLGDSAPWSSDDTTTCERFSCRASRLCAVFRKSDDMTRSQYQ